MNYYSIPGIRSMKKITISKAIKMTADYFGITENQLITKDRSEQQVVKAGQMLSYYLSAEMGMKPQIIGDYLNRERTAIMYRIQRVMDICYVDKDYKKEYLQYKYYLS